MFASKEWVKDLLTKVLKKNNEKINKSLDKVGLLDYANAITPFSSDVYNTTYTAPKSGVLFLAYTNTASAAYFSANINGVVVASYREPSASTDLPCGMVTAISMSKDDVINIVGGAYAMVNASTKFVPYK